MQLLLHVALPVSPTSILWGSQPGSCTYKQLALLVYDMHQLYAHPALVTPQDIPPMREGGKRLVIAPPGPMQRQGVKSLTWVTGLLEAIDEAGGETLLSD